MVHIIPNYLVLHFAMTLASFMKIRTKIPKLQMHKNLHKNVNENRFSFTFLCNFSCQSVYDGQLKQKIRNSFTLLISYMVFNPFKMPVQFF